MFSERLAFLYTAMEEKYYSLLDFLDKKGVPVYSYNDFLEEKGLPAFPITIALIVLIIALLYGLLFVGGSIDPSLTVDFSDQFNEPVSNVTLTVKDSAGNLLRSPDKVSNGETIALQGIPLGTELVLIAEKNGFQKAEQTIPVSKKNIPISIPMQKEVAGINASVRLVDSETRDPVRGAYVTAEWLTSTRQGTSDADGKVELSGIQSNTEILIVAEADGYEASRENYTFLDGETKTINLFANSASFQGNSKLVVSVEDEAGNPIQGTKVTLMDNLTETPIQELTLEQSEGVFSVAKGESVRLLVEKEGFLTYDSLDYGETRTVRQDEELWPVILAKGGSRLIITAFVGQSPLSDATVQLYALDNSLKAEDITGFGGTAEFTGLSPEEFYITAYKQGYLPARQKVNVAGTEKASLSLEPADQTNSSYLGISVLDSYMAGAGNANLKFFEKSQGEVLPLGIPTLKTDLTGYASIVARTGTVAIVEAEKDLQTGFGEKTVEANKENQLVIELSRPVNVLELQVLDEEGNLAAGTVTIESVAGELLYEDFAEEGRVFFDTEGNKDVLVKVETLEGETFSQKLSVEGKETLQVNLGEAAAGIAPTLEFTGVLNDLGEPAEGIVAGKDYWLAFQASIPTGVEKAGFHIRAGDDSIAFVDSQAVGITGFEAATSDFFYGTSYQPLPSPGSETADRQNVGTAGQLNKFLELYFLEPENTIAFTVKVRSRDLLAVEEFEMHFRGWSEVGGKLFRFPEDSELGEKSFTAEKTSLYAETQKATVKVFSSEASCDQDLCGNYYFVLPNGLYVDKQDFVAVTEDTYALQIELSAKKPLNVTLKLDTDKTSPKIEFTGYDVDEFVDQQEGTSQGEVDLSAQGYLYWPEGSQEGQQNTNPLDFKEGGGSTSLTVTGLGVSPDRSRKVRAYFRAIAEGKAEIKMQAASDSVLNQDFVFEVQRNKELHVVIEPREIEAGEPFTVRVMDGEDGSYIQEATVQVKDSEGALVKTLVGRGSTRKGLDGEYYFKDLEPGFYTLDVHVKGYKSFEQEFSILASNLLSTHKFITVDIDIPKGKRSETKSFKIPNNSGKDATDITWWFETEAGFPEEFIVSVENMPKTVSANQDLVASIRVDVNPEEGSEEHLSGETSMFVEGLVGGAKGKKEVLIKINYNRQLDEGCLKIDKSNFQIRVLGRAGSSTVGELEVENGCGQDLTLRAIPEAVQTDPSVTLTAPTLSIGDGQTEKLKLTATNNVDRMALFTRRDFKVKLESDQLTKTVPVTVTIDNPQFNLSYPPNVALWMVRNELDNRAYAETPFHVMNNGPVPVTGLQIAVDAGAYRNYGVTAGFKPFPITGISLDPGVSLVAPGSGQYRVYAQSEKTEALQQSEQGGWISLRGTVGGRQREIGQIPLTVNYSGTKCLKAEAVENPDEPIKFTSKDASQGTLERDISVTNQCREPVRLTGTIKPKMVSGNTFDSSPPNVILNAGQTQTFKLILAKGAETNRAAAVKVVGLLTRQNQEIESNEIRVILKLGEEAATADGKATAAVSVKSCENETTKRMTFPLLSEDCGQGYCDAKQLAEYLVEKMETAAKIAEDKIRQANNRKEGIGKCTESGYCSFEQMGILNDRFPVYLQLDFMTPEVLSKALRKSSELKGYDVTPGSRPLENIGSVGFSLGNVYLGGTFKGCGKYYVTIDGAAMASAGEIMLPGGKNFMIVINVEERQVQGEKQGTKTNRLITEECKHLIQNTSNFLPVDEGFTRLEHNHAWPGLVESGQEFDKLGKEFAETLFGTAEGRQAASISATSNKLEIVKGGLKPDELLRISIKKDGKGSSSDQPKTVLAHVPSHYSEDNTELAEEIAKAFATFKANNMEYACWGQDEEGEYIAMKGHIDTEKLYGKLAITGKDKAIRITNGEQCIDLEVTSKAAEKVTFDISLDTVEALTGIKKVSIFAKGKGELTALEPKTPQDKSAEGTSELALKKVETPGAEQYKAEFKLCVAADEHFPIAAQAIKDIKITAKGIANRTASHKVSVEACGIHPIELVKKMAEVSAGELEKGDKEYYAFVSWNGDMDEKVALNAMRKYLAIELAKEKAKDQFVGGSGVHVPAQKKWKQDQATKILKATGAFFGACNIVSGAELAASAFYPPMLRNALYDGIYVCGMPSLIAARNATRLYGETWEEANEFIDTVTKFMAPLVMAGSFLLRGGRGILATAPAATPLLIDSINQDTTHMTADELVAESESFKETIVNQPGFVGGWIGKTLNLGADVGRIISADNINYLAGKYADMIKLDATFIPDATIRTEIASEVKKSFATTLRSNVGKPMTQEIATSMGQAATASASDKIAKGLSQTTGLSPTLQRDLVDSPWMEAYNKNLDEILPATGVDNTSFRQLAEGAAGAKPQPPSTFYGPAWTQYQTELSDWQTRVNNSMDDFVRGTADDIVNEIARKTGQSSDDVVKVLGNNFQPVVARTNLENQIRNRGSAYRAYQAARGNSGMKRLIGIKGKEAQAAEKLFNKVVKENDDMKKLIDPSAYGKVKLTEKITLGQRVKNLGTFIRGNWRSIIANLGMGVATGFFADYLGYRGYKAFWDHTKPLEEGKTVIGAKSTLGVSDKDMANRPVINVDELKNGAVYRITASIDDYGRIKFMFFEVSKKELDAVGEELRKNPEKEWKGDCKMYAEEPVPQFIGSLVPEEEDGIPASLRLAYYNNAETLYALSDKVPEWIMMAVLSVEPTAVPECDAPKEWYLEESKEKRDNWLNCVAKKVKEMGVLGDDGKPGIYKGRELAMELETSLDLWKRTQWAEKVG